MSDALPQGWATARIEQVIAHIQPGFASGEKNVEGGIAHLRMNNIGLDGNLVLDLVRTVPEKLAKPQHDLKRGDVLICTTNSGKLVGKCAYFDLPGRYAFSNHLTRLRPKSTVMDGDFLRWNLWLQWQLGTFDDKCKHWVNQSTIPKAALLEIEVVGPPLAEQRRIVAKLKTLLGKVEACEKRLAKIPVILKRFRQSVLAAACSGQLTADWREKNTLPLTPSPQGRGNKGDVLQTPSPIEGWGEREKLPEGWAFSYLKNLCNGFQYGTSTKSLSAGKVPVLRMGNIQNGKVDWSNLVYTSNASEIKKYHLNPGDVLFNRTNSPELVGKTGIYRGERPAIFAGYLIRIKNRPEIDSDYLNYCLNATFAREWCQQVKSDGVSQSNINAQKLATFPIPLPPLTEQQEIVRRVETLFKKADEIEARYKKAKFFVDRLTQSILAKAFRGELVPQDPNDDPASVPLERIRDAKEKAIVSCKQKRGK